MGRRPSMRARAEAPASRWRRARWAARAAVLALGLTTVWGAWPRAGHAASWGGVEPGISTVEDVRERHGAPTREIGKKVDGYDTLQWVYERAQAPAGMVRMTIDFGLLTPGGYKASVVRVLRLDPKPQVFPRPTVLDGWGIPDRGGNQQGHDVFIYDAGLVVTFDQEGMSAESMIFMVPQAASSSIPEHGSAAPSGPTAPSGSSAPSGSGAPSAPAPKP
jgi:hypothetical protein